MMSSFSAGRMPGMIGCVAALQFALVCGHVRGDDLWLPDGTALRGSVLKTASTQSICVSAPWSEGSFPVKGEHVRRVDLCATRESLTPDIRVGLTNGLRLSLNLADMTKDALKVRQADKSERSVPWSEIESIVFPCEQETIFSSTADGWDLKRWKGTASGWKSRNGCLERNSAEDAGDSAAVWLELPDKPSRATALLRIDRIKQGQVLLARTRADPPQNVVLRLDSDGEAPGLLEVRVEMPGGMETQPPKCRIPDRNLDLRIDFDAETVRVYVCGPLLLTISLPRGAGQVLGFGGETDFALRELVVTSGEKFPELPESKRTDGVTVYLRNADVISTGRIRPSKESIELDLMENVVTLPVGRVKGIRFQTQTSANAANREGTFAEVWSEGRMVGAGELIAIAPTHVSLKDTKAGAVWSFPRSSGITVFLPYGDPRMRSPWRLAEAVINAIEKKDIATVRESMLSIGSGGLREIVEELGKDARISCNVTFLKPELVGCEIATPVRTEVTRTAPGQDPEKEANDQTVFLIRHEGRWYLQMAE